MGMGAVVTPHDTLATQIGRPVGMSVEELGELHREGLVVDEYNALALRIDDELEVSKVGQGLDEGESSESQVRTIRSRLNRDRSGSQLQRVGDL